MSDEDVPATRVRCSDCVHSEAPVSGEPCRSCYVTQRRKFVARTPAVATAETVAASDARDEEVTDDVVCHGCVHSETPLRLEPCRTCFSDPARPGFVVTARPATTDTKDQKDVSCSGCVHDMAPLRSIPCRACFHDPAKPAYSRVAAYDEVERPAHYTHGAVECIDAIEAAVTGLEGVEAVLTGQVLKYLWRWRHKGHPLEDLRKARWYLDRLLARAGGGAPEKNSAGEIRHRPSA